MFEIDKKSDDGFYVAGWAAIGVTALIWGILALTGLQPFVLLRPCAVHTLTGLYCPGCGGTRAVVAFLRGDLLRSLLFHPFVLYVAVVCGWFMASQTVERLLHGRIHIGMHFREIYMWIALGIILCNFLVKNLALLIWHVDLLA